MGDDRENTEISRTVSDRSFESSFEQISRNLQIRFETEKAKIVEYYFMHF